MNKLLLLFLCLIFAVADPALAMAEPAAPAATEAVLETEAVATPPRVPRPSYKRYRGNSRRKYRRNIFRRWSAKRRAKQKAKSTPRRGVITVEPPVRN
ncbi:hypothetical protein [Solirubrum puertoriconensis]|uniref:Uncharacterized protein n=1 Tax=Solirubrum puertoriconensis TaxID=1751427 RepID=A0A9X0L2Z3_SOLP1|nr:hypothetical protein [Solirubrum puertoriconensis]KUG05854.1 hypothetical protein ASU33_00240 [Solirubrum puertoriconensis]